MNFQSQGFPLSREGINNVCSILAVSDVEVWSILNVETSGFGFLSDRRPQILFERHIFHKLTNGKFDTTNLNISNASTGGYIGGTSEYSRLEKAITLDRKSALQSASWGIGQVMGSNHVSAGFTEIEAMVAAIVNNEDAQLLAMANFIKANHLTSALQRQNWQAFARGYNGSNFKENDYDTRLAASYENFKVSLPDLRLRTAQVALLYLGFDPGKVDGLRGRRTSTAIFQFQEKSKLPQTGQLEPVTEDKLLEEAFKSVVTTS
jgi:hypothetical protein